MTTAKMFLLLVSLPLGETHSSPEKGKGCTPDLGLPPSFTDGHSGLAHNRALGVPGCQNTGARFP